MVRGEEYTDFIEEDDGDGLNACEEYLNYCGIDVIVETDESIPGYTVYRVRWNPEEEDIEDVPFRMTGALRIESESESREEALLLFVLRYGEYLVQRVREVL